MFFEDSGRSLQTVGSRDAVLGGATAWYRTGSGAAKVVAAGDAMFSTSTDNPSSKTVPNRW